MAEVTGPISCTWSSQRVTGQRPISALVRNNSSAPARSCGTHTRFYRIDSRSARQFEDDAAHDTANPAALERGRQQAPAPDQEKIGHRTADETAFGIAHQTFMHIVVLPFRPGQDIIEAVERLQPGKGRIRTRHRPADHDPDTQAVPGRSRLFSEPDDPGGRDAGSNPVPSRTAAARDDDFYGAAASARGQLQNLIGYPFRRWIGNGQAAAAIEQARHVTIEEPRRAVAPWRSSQKARLRTRGRGRLRPRPGPVVR